MEGAPGRAGDPGPLVIRVLCAGRNRAAFVREGLDLLLPRLKRYRLELLENPKPGPPREEAQFLLRHQRPGRRVLALTPEGRIVDTPGLAALIAHDASVDWWIGGADGLTDEVKAAADEQISLSALTLSHELALLVLVEQLYRAETLATGHPYHR